jgi:hypothetical protein
MIKHYSKETIAKLKERFVCCTKRGRNAIWDVEHAIEVSSAVLLDSASSIEGERLHHNWKDQWMAIYSELCSGLSFIIKSDYIPNNKSLIPIKGSRNQFIENTWRASKIKATAQKGDVSLFLEFMERMFPFTREREQVIATMAMNVINPEVKIRYALLLRGEQGTGKGTLLDSIWQPLVGNNYSKVSCQDIANKFNAFMANSTLVVIDELYSDKKKNADRLKTLITDEKISVEKKGEDRIQVINYSLIVATSNDRVPIYIEANADRRWTVLNFMEHKESQEETKEFIGKKLIPWLEGDGLQLIRNHLEGIDLKKFDFDTAMETESKSEIAYSDAKEDEKVELDAFLEDECFYAIRLDALRPRFPRLNQPELVDSLRKFGYQKTENARRMKGGRRCRYWVNPEIIDDSNVLSEPSCGYLL